MRLTQALKDRIPVLYLEEKMTPSKIGAMFGVSDGTIRRFVNSQGFARSRSAAAGGHKTKLLSEAINLYKQGNCCREVGLLLGINEAAIARWLRTERIIRSKSDAQKQGWITTPSRASLSGEKHPAWKGGRKTSNGYVFIYARGNPGADSKGYIPEHRLVWEQVHNRPLPEGWAVHHLNGVKRDNRPENLLGLPTQKHDLVIPTMKKRIRELEAKVKLLEHALDVNQLMFTINEN